MLNVQKEVAAMEQMSVGQLQKKYVEVFGESTNGRHKLWLIKRIAWRMQANDEGDLSERARRRAMELANDSDLRTTAPKPREEAEPKPRSRKKPESILTPTPATNDSRLPMPGAVLTREYRGRKLQVTVLRDGFEFEGEAYKSLTAVARAATGKHWNGFHFFNLRKGGNQ